MKAQLNVMPGKLHQLLLAVGSKLSNLLSGDDGSGDESFVDSKVEENENYKENETKALSNPSFYENSPIALD